MSRRGGVGLRTLYQYRKTAMPGYHARQRRYIQAGQRARYRARWGSARPFRRGRDMKSGFYGRFNRRRGTHYHHAELKFHDVTVGLSPLSITGTFFDSLLTIPQGTSENERIGRKCTVKSLGLRFNINLLTQDMPNETTDVVKMYVILNTQTNGSNISTVDFLETTNVHSFRDLANTGRFKVLATRKYALQSTAGGNTNFARSVVCDEINLKLNLPIEYNGTTGIISEMRSNNILLLFISLEGRCSVEMRTRIRFQG